MAMDDLGDATGVVEGCSWLDDTLAAGGGGSDSGGSCTSISCQIHFCWAGEKICSGGSRDVISFDSID